MTAAATEPSGDAPLSAAEAETLFADLLPEAALLVAVSGGPDSVALLALLKDWSLRPGRPRLLAATVDHGLRPESAQEAAGVGGLCAALGIAHAVLRWDGGKPATGLQSRARAARYGLLADEARRFGAAIVTAHTRDDQAETLLMRMAHGSGPSGLAGMRARTQKAGVPLLRPLLGIAKARLIATVQARGLAFVQDPSNADPRFERVRWRGLMPDLAARGLDAERLWLLAQRIARLDDVAQQRAAILLPALVLTPPGAAIMRLQFSALLSEPDEIALRILALALEAGSEGEPLRLERLEACGEALLAAAREGGTQTRTLGGRILALSRAGVLTIRPEGERRRGIHPAAS